MRSPCLHSFVGFQRESHRKHKPHHQHYRRCLHLSLSLSLTHTHIVSLVVRYRHRHLFFTSSSGLILRDAAKNEELRSYDQHSVARSGVVSLVFHISLASSTLASKRRQPYRRRSTRSSNSKPKWWVYLIKLAEAIRPKTDTC